MELSIRKTESRISSKNAGFQIFIYIYIGIRSYFFAERVKYYCIPWSQFWKLNSIFQTRALQFIFDCNIQADMLQCAFNLFTLTAKL